MKRAVLAFSLAALASGVWAQTSPMEQFGHNLGDDYFLANYAQLTEYWKKLDRESDRFKMVDIGKTEEGRTQYMAIVSDPANMRRLDHYREIAEKLARAEDLTEEEAARLAKEGKSIVWVDGGLHASEVLCAQVLMELGWQLVSKNDDETTRILKDTIVLLVHANPDGHALLANWYMRKDEPTERSSGGVPRLYQKYIGHDNNRDFFTSTQSETENMNRVMYREWYPQIIYNMHQTGPRGTVMFAPPFRDPFAYEVDPLVRTGLDMVSASMHNRFMMEDKPGVTMRTGASYSTWWNGGLRTTAYFHNMVGILTETIGHPTPISIPWVTSRQLPHADLPMPIEPQQVWHFRQSVDYNITANYGILDYASRNRSNLLMNIWRMGRNAIAAGSGDSWVPNPRMIGEARSLDAIRKPEDRAARAYIVPSDQPDFGTATRFINALIETGIDVHQAHRSFAADGEIYPAGSYVVRCDQAFRAHVISMFEPQVHPDDFAYPGADPSPPYDSAGWTLAFLMGVDFVRIIEDFDVRMTKLEDNAVATVSSALSPNASGYVIDPRSNDAFRAVSRLLALGASVSRMDDGSFWVSGSSDTRSSLQRLAREHGVRVADSTSAPVRGMTKLRAPRVALMDRYGGSMDSGWTRWIFEQFEIPFTVVYPPEIDAGVLSNFDVLVLPSGMTFSGAGGGGGGRSGGGAANRQNDETIPAEWRARMGSLTVATSLPLVRAFVEGGGTVVAIGSSTRIGQQLELDVTSALINDEGNALRNNEFFVPGSVLSMAINTNHPLAAGMDDHADVMFRRSPAFRVGDSAEVIAWFDSDAPLRSGWAWGQAALKDAVAAASFNIGSGRVVLYGPEITFRSQPHGTFKLLFNALMVGE